MRETKHPNRAGRWTMIVFLATGPERKLNAWQLEARWDVELFDRRKQTVRCRAHGDEIDRGQRAYDSAVELARKHDVTIQDLVSAGDDEEYPVVHLGSHGMTWPPAKASRKRETRKKKE